MPSRREPLSIYGNRRQTPRMTSLLAMLLAIAFIYYHARKPGAWEWLVNDNAAVAVEQVELIPDSADVDETIVPGPTDLDAAETEDAKGQFEAVRDKAPLVPTEMSAYWRSMKWARAQSFQELNDRAADKVKYSELWEHPEEYRGKPIRLRLHVRRILEYPAPQNSAGVEKTYEVWGWTDQSRSHPYVVVVSELPASMQVGEEVEEEGLFVGYFLKTISYTAFDKPRAAPLLIGRLRDVGEAPPAAMSTTPTSLIWLAAAAVVLIGGVMFFHNRKKRTAARAPLTRSRQGAAFDRDESELADWFENQPAGSEDELPDVSDRRRR